MLLVLVTRQEVPGVRQPPVRHIAVAVGGANVLLCRVPQSPRITMLVGASHGRAAARGEGTRRRGGPGKTRRAGSAHPRLRVRGRVLYVPPVTWLWALPQTRGGRAAGRLGHPSRHGAREGGGARPYAKKKPVLPVAARGFVWILLSRTTFSVCTATRPVETPFCPCGATCVPGWFHRTARLPLGGPRWACACTRRGRAWSCAGVFGQG